MSKLPWILATGLLLNSTLYATTEVWTYSVPSPASVTVADGEIATVNYTVTNKSHRSKNLILDAEGISASPCYLAGKNSTCSLTLTINGSLVPPQGITEGPMLCEQGNPSQCYQPSDKNLLKVYRATSVTYQVTPGAGAHINSIIPSSVQTVNAGTTQQFTVNAETGYVVEDGTYSDWYLPSLCELMRFCGIQNIFDTLYLLGFGTIADGNYWSSNENATFPAGYALFAFFDSTPYPGTGSTDKFRLRNVRCARAIN